MAVGGDGKCTLREAITNANTNSQLANSIAGDCAAGMAGLDNIQFNIGSGTPSIAIAGLALPTITEPIIINGNTGGAARVELNGAGAGGNAAGLLITAGGSTINALVVNRFAHSGIELTTGGGNIIQNSYIGTDAAGTTDLGNTLNGVIISNSSNNIIGGIAAGAGNVISGNGNDGVLIMRIVNIIAQVEGNVVAGNFIGTDVSGTIALGNSGNGVSISSAVNNIIGGTSVGAGNLISSNKGYGVNISGIFTTGNQILGNYIGTDVTGSAALGNTLDGVSVQLCTDNIIGGTLAGARNLISGNSGCGVYISGLFSIGNQVLGNYIGTDASGTAALGNALDGVMIEDATSSIIGGTAPGARNLISGNRGHGVDITNARSNQVLGNYIGTNVTGTAALGNTLDGVRIQFTSNNIIGGTIPGARNLISGNNGNGVLIADISTMGNQVLGNYIGTDASGMTALGNSKDGVVIGSTPNIVGAGPNIIGGSNIIGGAAAAGNLISGNGGNGVAIGSVFTIGNQVLGNFIGTDVTGTFHLGNNQNGVFIFDSSNNAVGGTMTGEHNLISGNDARGVYISGSNVVRNRVLGNSIFGNSQLGIDLGLSGVTPNDADDPDPGPNNLQNFPLLSLVGSSNGQTNIQGRLNSLADSSFRIEFFSNDLCDPSGNGEGQTFIGFQNVTTIGNDAQINATLPVAVAAGKFITATATRLDSENNPIETSEFSACIVTLSQPSLVVTLQPPAGCRGAGNVVGVTASITNPNPVAQQASFTTTLPEQVFASTSTCTATVGTCTVINGGTVTWLGTLAPNQGVTISFSVQLGDVTTGMQLCLNSEASFGRAGTTTQQACLTVNCPSVGPGLTFPAASETSDQNAGSVLIYNIYTSGATSGNTQNTRINITNTHLTLSSFVHLFFVAEGCAVADSYICLTGNQTASFLASDLDPGMTGYIVAVAVNQIGCPTSFNYLIGDEYVKFTSGHAANLGAIAFSQLAGGLPACDGTSNTAMINFDGISYNRTPATLGLDNVGSRADGNDTLLIVNRIGGNLGIGASTLGTLFGIFYDDAENALSFSVTGSCQLRSSITNNFPRITPRFETFVPAGRTGWLKIFNQTGAVGITGAAINFNPNASSSAGAFNQGHNLHHLTLRSAETYIIPVFPPSC